MLVLSRKQGERLQIGDNVTITVLEVRGRKLTLGIQAPRGVRILRAELELFDRSAPAAIRRTLGDAVERLTRDECRTRPGRQHFGVSA